MGSRIEEKRKRMAAQENGNDEVAEFNVKLPTAYKAVLDRFRERVPTEDGSGTRKQTNGEVVADLIEMALEAFEKSDPAKGQKAKEQ